MLPKILNTLTITEKPQQLEFNLNHSNSISTPPDIRIQCQPLPKKFSTPCEKSHSPPKNFSTLSKKSQLLPKKSHPPPPKVSHHPPKISQSRSKKSYLPPSPIFILLLPLFLHFSKTI